MLCALVNSHFTYFTYFHEQKCCKMLMTVQYVCGLYSFSNPPASAGPPPQSAAATGRLPPPASHTQPPIPPQQPPSVPSQPLHGLSAAGPPRGLPAASVGHQMHGMSQPVPRGIAPVPGGIAPAPGGIATVPGNIAPAPEGIAPAPGGIAPVPGGIAPVPGGVNIAPRPARPPAATHQLPTSVSVLDLLASFIIHHHVWV